MTINQKQHFMIVYNLTLNHFGFTKHQNQIHENLAVKNDVGTL